MPASATAVRLSKLRIDRGGRTILRDIDLSVPVGSITAVLGPSGSGKSTLLAALTGELVPVSGTVELFGNEVPRSSRPLLEMRKGIGVLLQPASHRELRHQHPLLLPPVALCRRA